MRFAFSALFVFAMPCNGIQRANSSTADINGKPSNQFYFGGSYTHVNLKPSNQTSFDGNLGGIQAGYEYRPSQGLYEGLMVSWREGITHGGGDAKRFLVDVDTQARLGYTFPIPSDWVRFSLFSGFGFRYLEHELTQPGSAKLYFYYKEYYVPVGGLFDAEVNSYFSTGFYCTWLPEVDPTVRIQPLNGARWVLRKSLGNIRLEVPFLFTIRDCYDCHVRRSRNILLNIKPFFEYWRDGRSTAVTDTGLALGLPANRYTFWGVDVNLTFAF